LIAHHFRELRFPRQWKHLVRMLSLDAFDDTRSVWLRSVSAPFQDSLGYWLCGRSSFLRASREFVSRRSSNNLNDPSAVTPGALSVFVQKIPSPGIASISPSDGYISALDILQRKALKESTKCLALRRMQHTKCAKIVDIVDIIGNGTGNSGNLVRKRRHNALTQLAAAWHRSEDGMCRVSNCDHGMIIPFMWPGQFPMRFH
jgi:hypothetical protein